jgi:hypothetical protein
MRRADRVVELEQRMIGVEDRLVFIDIDSRETGRRSTNQQGAVFDQLGWYC